MLPLFVAVSKGFGGNVAYPTYLNVPTVWFNVFSVYLICAMNSLFLFADSLDEYFPTYKELQ